NVATRRGDSEVGRVDQPSAGQSFGRSGGDFSVRGDDDGRSRGVDESAVPSRGRAGVQRAGNVDGAGLHIAQQFDYTLVILDGLRLDNASVIGHRVEQITR